MVYKGNNQFAIQPNMFDFNIEWQNGFSARNVGTIFGGAINYNLMISPAAALVPYFFGGSYNVIFKGTTYIPK
jgi:hypothetical protein